VEGTQSGVKGIRDRELSRVNKLGAFKIQKHDSERAGERANGQAAGFCEKDREPGATKRADPRRRKPATEEKWARLARQRLLIQFKSLHHKA